jgi:hypothetical protein
MVLLVAVPAGVVTEMGPLVAPAGTLATTWPVMVTMVPAGPDVGVKLLICGVTLGVIRPIDP